MCEFGMYGLVLRVMDTEAFVHGFVVCLIR